jgi:hypothetical protein
MTPNVAIVILPNLTKVQSLKDVDLGKLEITKKIERIKSVKKSQNEKSTIHITNTYLSFRLLTKLIRNTTTLNKFSE